MKIHLNTIEPALQEYLKLTRPSKMLVFSERVWIAINGGTYIETLRDEEFDKAGTVFKFDYQGGHCYGIGIHHPSSTKPYFRPHEWKPLVFKFLEKKYD